MAKIKYEESKADRDHLRDLLRRRGKDSVDQIAQALRERWHHGHLRSYRLAVELSQPQACAQVNGLQGVGSGEPGYLDSSTLSKFEHWPAGGRRPTAGYLIVLAQVFGTSPRRLIAEQDWDAFTALDRLTLRAADQAAAGAVASVGTVGMMGVARPPAGSTPRTPPNWWVAPETPGSGNPIERAVTMANDESARYADRSGNAGRSVIDALRDDTAEQARRFATAPRLELLGSVRMLRDRIFAMLDGGQPIQQRRDLYFLGAAACGMLSAISVDLGYPSAGMSQARVGHVFATEAGDPALTGWLHVMQANVCYWNGQPGKARDYARKGAALRPGGTIGVWLPSTEARACGELGDAEGARGAIRRAIEVRDIVQPGTLDQFGGQLAFIPAKQHFYAASAYFGAGDDPATLAQADETIDAYTTAPAEEYSYINTTVVRFQAAIAHLRSGDLDAASESALAALSVEPEHRSAQTEKFAKKLHHHLRAPGVATSPLAVDTRDQIEEFLSATPARIEPS